MKSIFTYLLTLLCSVSVYAENDVEVIQVKDNIHVLISPAGGNVVVSTGEDGTFLIDDQLAGRTEIIRSAAKEISQQDIKFVLNTHYHFDHTGGNETLGEQGAVIVSHDKVRQRLSTKQFITYFGREMQPLNKVGLPTVTFSDDMTLYYNNDEIRLIHTPAAHTDGDSVAIFTKANVIVGGDLIFNGRYPFIDSEHGGTITGLITSIDALLAIADDQTVVIPGHGSVMDKQGLQKYGDVLKEVANNIDALKKSGKSLEQVIAEKPSSAFDAKYGNGLIPPEAFVTTIYETLAP
ncbi:hypothetical protein A9Q79_08925 [Methylophaga sp. 42_25_T18]|nr:hypothetical protein A9Q79_08925 [Methylophaga sp. 42_25_T18]OUR86048.1 hypothetical protein A9Q92_06760 [Methylophaga sp. 42_8_T64]